VRDRVALLRAAVGVGLVVAAVVAATASGKSNVVPARAFYTPGSHGANCEIDAFVRIKSSTWCVVEPPTVPAQKALGVTLTRSGHLKICRGLRCVGNASNHEPKLRYGHSVSFGAFRCTSLKRGVRCVVTKLGHGFLLGAHRVKRV
jgi:hypothetical protein